MRVYLILMFGLCGILLNAQASFSGGSYDGFATANSSSGSFNLYAGGSNDGFGTAGLGNSNAFNMYAGGANDGFSSAAKNAVGTFNLYAGGGNDGFSAASASAQGNFNMFAGGVKDGFSNASLASLNAFNLYAGGRNDGFHMAAVSQQTAFNLFAGGAYDGFSGAGITPLTTFNLYAGGVNDGFAIDGVQPCSPASNITAYFTNITSTSVSFNWVTANEGAQFLVLVYAAGITAPVHTYTGATVAGTNTVSFSGLTPNYSYCITVQEQCDVYRSAGVSPQFCFTTASASTCAAPTNQAVWFTSGQYLMVKWASPLYGNSSKGYQIAGGLNITSPAQATVFDSQGYYISQNPAFPSYPFFTGNVPGFAWFVRDICGPGDTSAWVGPYIVGAAKTNETETGIQQTTTQNEEPGFSIYPNPNNGTGLFIKAHGVDESAVISIYNMQGALVFQSTLTTQAIDVSSLSNGIYNLLLSTNTTRLKSQRLIIQR